jgi:hypothetical protein
MRRVPLSPTVGFLTAAAVVTSLLGLPMMAEEQLTMFVYVGFATLLFSGGTCVARPWRVTGMAVVAARPW